ncbi:MAG: hypothetical protein Q9N34_00710 [Aquificota bacterium]|nr:hypothetical protein [Aquificota bacterium]
MAIKALLLDRDREIFPLLGDIFNVTGHKLLIAASDDMFRELISSATVDVVIINQADIKSWVEVCGEDCTPLPFFIVEREEEERRLRSLGFSDLNYIRKPFNPLDLFEQAELSPQAGPAGGGPQPRVCEHGHKAERQKGVQTGRESRNSFSCEEWA